MQQQSCEASRGASVLAGNLLHVALSGSMPHRESAACSLSIVTLKSCMLAQDVCGHLIVKIAAMVVLRGRLMAGHPAKRVL